MLIEARGLAFSYRRKPVLQDIHFHLGAGEVVSLLGPNGSGKSTLMKILLGLLRGKGEVLLCGKPLEHYRPKEIARRIAYVPQVHRMPFSFRVLDVVLMGRLAHGSLFGGYSRQDERLAREALDQVGLGSLAERAFTCLSGGEQQLVLIGRALSQQADILFLDEPVNGLDYGNQIRLLRFLKAFAARGYAVLQTTHYPDHALYASQRVVLLENGRMLESGAVEQVLTSEAIQRLYAVDVEMVSNGRGSRFCVPRD